MPARPRRYMHMPTIISNDQFRRIMTTAKADSGLHDMLDVVHVLANTDARHRYRARTCIHRQYQWLALRPPRTEVSASSVALHERRPETEFILGAAPQRLLQRVSRQLRKFGGGQVSFGALRHTFRLRLWQAEVPVESLHYICGIYGYASRSKWTYILPPDLHYELAARHFARIEEF